MKKSRSVCLILVLGAGIIGHAQTLSYGDPADGYPDLPSWHERAIHVLTNACRTDPTAYRDTYIGSYNILLPENYPAVNPVYWNLGLNRAARFHAEDMADNCGMQHPSCDGTDWDERIQQYYTASGWIGENIATGRSTPQETMRQWLMDGDPPAQDSAPNNADGHRSNIMNNRYGEMGAGYAYNASRRWYHFWVQDFGGAKSDYRYHPVTAGSHIFVEAGKTTFLACFWDTLGRAPSAAIVVISDSAQPLALHLGTASRGTYSATVASASSCRHYYYSFTVGGKTWRYPESGFLMTYGEGQCATDYLPAESISVEIKAPQPAVSCGKTFTIFVTSRRVRVNMLQPDLRVTGVTVAGVNGRIVIRRPFAGARTIRLALDAGLAKGIYILALRLADGRVLTGKFVLL